MMISKDTKKTLDRVFQNAPQANFHLLAEDSSVVTDFLRPDEVILPEQAKALPQGTVALATGPSIQGYETNNYIIRTPDGTYYLAAEDEEIIPIVDDTSNLREVDIYDPTGSKYLYTSYLTMGSYLLYLLQVQDDYYMGSFELFTQEDADRYPL
jgi:hypothetical protein